MTDHALGLLGVDLDAVYTSVGELPHAQGIPVNTANGRVVLVKAGSAITQFALCVYAPSSAGASVSVDAFMASLTNVTSRLFAVAQTSIAMSSYGWLHIDCHKEGRVLCNTAETGVPLFLLGSAGQVDDAVVSGKALEGLIILESVATSVSAPRAIWRDIKLDKDQLA
jgi:hypothetical protein